MCRNWAGARCQVLGVARWLWASTNQKRASDPDRRVKPFRWDILYYRVYTVQLPGTRCTTLVMLLGALISPRSLSVQYSGVIQLLLYLWSVLYCYTTTNSAEGRVIGEFPGLPVVQQTC
jgi:hypothetical protein